MVSSAWTLIHTGTCRYKVGFSRALEDDRGEVKNYMVSRFIGKNVHVHYHCHPVLHPTKFFNKNFYYLVAKSFTSRCEKASTAYSFGVHSD